MGINWEERKSLPLATKKPLSRGCRSWGPDRRPSQLFRLSIFWVSLSALQLSGQNVPRIVERTDILRQAFDNRLSFDKHLWKLGPERKVIIVFKWKFWLRKSDRECSTKLFRSWQAQADLNDVELLSWQTWRITVLEQSLCLDYV